MTVGEYIRDIAGKISAMSDEELAIELFEFDRVAVEIGFVKKEDGFPTKEESLEWLRLPVNLEEKGK